MNNKDSLWFIALPDGRTARIVSGIISYLSTPAALPNAPVGWEEYAIAWERNLAEYGTIRNFSIPFGFVLDAGKIVREVLYTYNTDEERFLILKQLVDEIDDTYYRTYYKQLYKGELDFSAAVDNQSEAVTEIPIMEGGLHKLMKAQKTTKFFIPFDEDAVTVRMSGLRLYGKITYFVAKKSAYVDLPGPATSNLILYEISREGQAAGIAFFDQPYKIISDYEEALEYSIASTAQVSMTITSDLFFSSLLSEHTYNVYIKGSDGSSLTIGTISGVTGVYTMPINYTFLTAPDVNYFITVDSTAPVFAIQESRLSIDYSSIFAPTTTLAFRPMDLYRKLVENISGNPDNALSDLLPTLDYVFTSGDGLRGLEGAGITTSFSDFFDAINAYEMAGTQILDDGVHIDDRRTYFDNTKPPIPLGEIIDLKISPVTEFSGTTITVGNEEQQVDEVNGKLDPIGFNVYTTPVKRGEPKEIEIKSPYTASPYEIENYRINFEGKTTTDNNRDAKVFVLCVTDPLPPLEEISGSYSEDSGLRLVGQAGNIALFRGISFVLSGTSIEGTYEVLSATADGADLVLTVSPAPAAATFTGATIIFTALELDRSIIVTEGVPAPETLFNVPLSPARIIRSHYPWLASVFYKYNGVLPFVRASLNDKLVAGGITENAHLDISTFGTRLFIPFFAEFTALSPVYLQDELQIDPNRSFSFTWNGSEHKGFLIKAALAPNSRQEQTFKLLMAPDSDMTKFI